MSFSNDVKKELLSLPIKMNCCRKAMLFGLLFNAEHIEGTRMRVGFALRQTAELALSLLGNAPESISEGSRAGRRLYSFEFSSKPFSSFIFNISHGQSLSDAAKFRCEECRACFARGLLISLSTVNDPYKGYHLEIPISAGNAERLEPLMSFFEEIGFPAKRVERQNKVGAYFKSNTVISDILSYAGAMRSSFEMANTFIERDIRNNENRATNFVAKNISKSVAATQRQISAIHKLIEKGKLEQLSSELMQTALLRIENDDVSLSELALMHEPPISKSGLNHRLEKICDAVKDIDD